MTFAEAAMIMMSGGKKPIIKPLTPLTIDSIRALENMATITVGEFVWECKRPVTIGSGVTSVILTEGQKSKRTEIRHLMPFVINDKYAMLGVYGDYYTDFYQWREVDGVEKYYSTIYAEHRVSGAGYTKRNYSFINPQIDYSLYGTMYDSDDDRNYDPYEVYMGNVSVSFNGAMTITNMTPKEQGEFVKSYLESEAYNEPVINIL